MGNIRRKILLGSLTVILVLIVPASVSDTEFFQASIVKMAGKESQIDRFPKAQWNFLQRLKGKTILDETPHSLTELELFQLEKAFPRDRDSGLLTSLLPPLLEKYRLSLKQISFGADLSFPESGIESFSFTIQTSGLLSDALAFLREAPKQGRFMTVEDFDFTIIDVRSDVAIGNFKITLSAYYRNL